MLEQLDIETIFLYGNLEETIYKQQIRDLLKTKETCLHIAWLETKSTIIAQEVLMVPWGEYLDWIFLVLNIEKHVKPLVQDRCSSVYRTFNNTIYFFHSCSCFTCGYCMNTTETTQSDLYESRFRQEYSIYKNETKKYNSWQQNLNSKFNQLQDASILSVPQTALPS